MRITRIYTFSCVAGRYMYSPAMVLPEYWVSARNRRRRHFSSSRTLSHRCHLTNAKGMGSLATTNPITAITPLQKFLLTMSSTFLPPSQVKICQRTNSVPWTSTTWTIKIFTISYKILYPNGTSKGAPIF